MRTFCCFALYFLLLAVPVRSLGQQGDEWSSDDHFDPYLTRLLGKYLNEPDSAEVRITALIARSEQCLKKQDNLAALNHLLMAHMLEANAGCSEEVNLRLIKHLGAILSDMNPRHALFYLKKALDIGTARAPNIPAHTQGRFQMMGTIAGLYHKLAEPDSVFYWDRRAMDEASASLGNIAEASALNNLGVHLAKYQHYDSAVHYYRLALETLGNMENNRVLYCSIQDNIAQERERQGDYEYAYTIYRFNDSVFIRHSKLHRVVPNRIRLLEAARKLHRPEFRQELEKLARFVEEYYNHVHVRDRLEFYQFAKNHFLKAGPVQAAQHYDHLYNRIRDSLDAQFRKQADLVTATLSTVQTIRFQRETDLHKLESRSARQALYYSWALATAGMIGVGLLALLMRRRKRELDLAYRLTRAELHAKKLEAQTMAQAMEIQKSDITAMALHNTQVLDIQRNTIRRLTDIALQKKNSGEALNRFIAELQAQEQLSGRTRLVQENIERANAEFYQTLASRFPSLSKAEVDLCGYLRINLSSKDIAVLKNVAPASVKMSKNRLRKKMELDPETDLYAFIQAL